MQVSNTPTPSLLLQRATPNLTPKPTQYTQLMKSLPTGAKKRLQAITTNGSWAVYYDKNIIWVMDSSGSGSTSKIPTSIEVLDACVSSYGTHVAVRGELKRHSPFFPSSRLACLFARGAGGNKAFPQAVLRSFGCLRLSVLYVVPSVEGVCGVCLPQNNQRTPHR